MKLNMTKKILLLGLVLLIVAGTIVLLLKGLNVSLMYKEHEAMNLRIGKEIDYNEFNQMCKEVFGNKEFVLRKIELFDDSVNISVENITDEEKENLVSKINEKFEEEYTAQDIVVNKIPNIRLRDIVRPYIKPVIISAVLIIAYLIIRFRKNNVLELLGKLFLLIVFTELGILSLIAIIRLPVSSIVINLMSVVAIVELVIYVAKTEKNYKV